MAQDLAGLTILIVEDEYLVAVQIADAMHALGAEVAGPHARLEPALQVAERAALGGAILDAKLDSHTTEPVAEALKARAIPVLLATGLDLENLPEGLRDLPQLRKPLRAETLRRMAVEVFRR